jgi:peptidoglycan biosynthesis protein MviN/MurJ (putative lipid II flippase)
MSSTTMSHSDPLVIVRFLDVLLVVLAAPFVVLMGGPVLGYAAGAVAWIVTRVLGVVVERQARGRNAKTQVGLTFGVLMGRAWILGITILVVGIAAEREDGLMAALLALVAFTVYLATTLVLRPTERNTPRP